jgi:hypothetical protein
LGVEAGGKGGPALLAGTSSHLRHTLEEDEVLMIYETFTSNNQCKRALWEINAVRQVLPRGAWIDTPITFSQNDQPRSVLDRCPAALVLNPIVDHCRLHKVLMDGGSSLNLIYEDTLDKMHIDKSRIERSTTTFKGIVPGREARCSGKITLDIVFGTSDNYRSKEITFHIAPFNSGYHAILGRDAFSIFQAVPHYGYMKFKMPSPKGIITISSDPDRALKAENKMASLTLETLAETFAAEELTALRAEVDRDDIILDKRSKPTSFKPADEITKFQVHPTDPAKMASIGANLDPEVAEALCAFLKENWDIFA